MISNRGNRGQELCDMEVAVRRMRSEDIPQVVEIEQEAFSPGWIGTQFRRELNSKRCCFLVAYVDSYTEIPGSPHDGSAPPDASMWGRMVSSIKSVIGANSAGYVDDLAGYVGIWFQGDQAHITEIAVKESMRGQGIGELLIIGTVRAAYENGMEEVTLEARVSNFIAQNLYEKYGFNHMGIRKNYYADNREDAVIMTTDPIHTGSYRGKFSDLQEKFVERYGEIYIEL